MHVVESPLLRVRRFRHTETTTGENNPKRELHTRSKLHQVVGDQHSLIVGQLEVSTHSQLLRNAQFSLHFGQR